MDERKQYWQNVEGLRYSPAHSMMELRAALAWDLLSHFGAISGVYMDREDSARRAVMELQTPGALVTRCFAIADAFVNRAENREEIREIPEKEKPAAKTLGSAANDLIVTANKLSDDLNKGVSQKLQAGAPVPHNQKASS